MCHHIFHAMRRIFHHGGRCGIIAFAAAGLLAPRAEACCGNQAAAVAVRAAPVCAQAIATCAPAISMFYLPAVTVYRAYVYAPPPVVYQAPAVVYRTAPVVVQPGSAVVARAEVPPPPQPDVQAQVAPRSVFQLPPESAATEETTTTTTTVTHHAAQQQAYVQQEAAVAEQYVAADQFGYLAGAGAPLVGAVPLKVGLFGRLRVDRSYAPAVSAGVPFAAFIMPRGRGFGRF